MCIYCQFVSVYRTWLFCRILVKIHTHTINVYRFSVESSNRKAIPLCCPRSKIKTKSQRWNNFVFAVLSKHTILWNFGNVSLKLSCLLKVMFTFKCYPFGVCVLFCLLEFASHKQKQVNWHAFSCRQNESLHCDWFVSEFNETKPRMKRCAHVHNNATNALLIQTISHPLKSIRFTLH